MPNVNVRNPTHTWRRFWCKPNERKDHDDVGFLIDPESDFGKYFQPHAVALDRMEGACAVLVGEPGMGKSTTIAFERARLASAGQPTLAIELRRDCSESAIRKALESYDGYRSWIDGDETFTLFLDGLDEGLPRNAALADDLLAVIASLPKDRLRLRLSCRTLEWRPASKAGSVAHGPKTRWHRCSSCCH